MLRFQACSLAAVSCCSAHTLVASCSMYARLQADCLPTAFGSRGFGVRLTFLKLPESPWDHLPSGLVLASLNGVLGLGFGRMMPEVRRVCKQGEPFTPSPLGNACSPCSGLLGSRSPASKAAEGRGKCQNAKAMVAGLCQLRSEDKTW